MSRRPYYQMTDAWLKKLSQAGFEMPDTFNFHTPMPDDHAWLFIKLLEICADEAYLGDIKSHNNGLTHGRTTWAIEDFEDQEERTYDNLADGLADTWIRNSKRADD